MTNKDFGGLLTLLSLSLTLLTGCGRDKQNAKESLKEVDGNRLIWHIECVARLMLLVLSITFKEYTTNLRQPLLIR